MVKCPNTSHPLWKKLVAKVGIRAAYATYIHMGETLPHVGTRDANKLKYNAEEAFGLVKYSTLPSGTRITKKRGFDRNTARRLIDDIKANYVGDFVATQGTPSPGMKGEFSVEIHGWPIEKKDKILNVEQEVIDYIQYKEELTQMYEEANETILPHDPDRADYFLEMHYIGDAEQRGRTAKSILEDSYDVSVISRTDGSLRKIQIQDKNRIKPNSAIATLTIHRDENYPNYASIGIAYVQEDFRNKGIATDMYQVLMESLPEGMEGFVSKLGSRMNTQEISTIHRKLDDYFNIEELDNGDILFRKKEAQPVRRNISPDTRYTSLSDVAANIRNSENYLDNAERKELDRQKEFLMRAFPQVEEVIEDYNMPLLGSLEAGGRTIRINPLRMKEDTLFHEFGHLMIDLLGGMNNSTVNGAYESLVNSEVYIDVSKRYPELLGTEKFKREVVAQALGVESEQVWQNYDKKTAWEKFLYDLLNNLKNLLGINRSEIKKLAREMVTGNPLNPDNYPSHASNVIQEQRDNIDLNNPETIVTAVKELSSEVDFQEVEHKYFLGEVELMAVSSIMNRAGYGIKPGEETPAVIEGQRLGTTIHKNAEAISNGVQEIVKVDTGYEMSRKAHGELKQLLSEMFGDQYTLLNEVIIPDAEAQMAGTIDVLALDKDNNLIMFDFKTKRAEKGFKYYDSTKFGHSQRDINSLQLSLYKRMLKRSLGLDVKSLNIVMLTAEVNKYNKIMGMSIDTQHSENGIVELPYNRLANDLIRERVKEIQIQDETLPTDEIEENSIQAENIRIVNESLDKYQTIYNNAVDTFRDRLSNARNKNWSGEIDRLDDLLDRMTQAAVDPKRGIGIFVQEAVNQISKFHDLYLERQQREQNGEENVWTPTILMKWYEFLGAYDNLEDVSKLLLEEGIGLPKSQINKYRRIVDNAIGVKNFLRDLYKEKGSKILAESYYPLITRVEREVEEDKMREWDTKNPEKAKKMSRKERDAARKEYAKKYMDENITDIYENTRLRFEQELHKAHEDIGYMARWLDTVLNTNDMVTAAMVKSFVIEVRTAREKAISKRQDMIALVREVEDLTGYDATTPVENLYDYFLEKDSKGNYSGHLLQKYNSALHTATNEMMEKTKTLPAPERRKARRKWRKENGADINWDNLNIDWFKYAEELQQQGVLNETELVEFKKNEENDFRYKQNVNKVINPEAADALIKWKLDNIGEYLEITNDKWINKGWPELEKILQNPEDPRAKLYNFIIDLQNEADSYLPKNSKLNGALPAITKSFMEAIQSGRNIMDITKAEFRKRTQVMSEDIERGQKGVSEMPIFFLPTFYKRGADFDLADQSYDIATLYFSFYKMAIDFSHKSEIIGEMELTKQMIKEREYTVRDAKGNPIKKMFANARDRELTKSGQASLLAEQVEDFFKSDIYGRKSEGMGDFEILGLKFDKAKFIDNLSSYSAINMLGLNFVQGIANVTLGEIQNITEAMGGEFVDMSDIHKATAFYFNPSNMGNMLADIGSRSPSSVINMLNEKFDVLNDYEGGIYRKSSKFAQLMTSNTLFFTSQIGEHYMQTRFMLAMMLKKEAKDSNGEVIGNMLEMYSSENGKLKIDDRVDLQKSNWAPQQQILFGEKINRILSELHGEYGNVAKNAIQRHALGRAAIMFRKFLFPGYIKRYGELRYNEFIEDYREGSYRQFGRFMQTAIKDLAKLKFALVQENYNKLLPRERANIKRAITEFSFALSATFLGGILTNLVGESDDDKERWALSFLAYQAKRTRSELLFFNPLTPGEALNILVSPAASISTIENIAGLATQLTLNPFDTYQSGPWKDRLKISKKAMKLTPGIKQWYRLKDIEESINLFDFN